MRRVSRPLLLAIACGLAAPAAAAPVPTSAYLTVAVQGLASITLVGGGVVSVSGTTISVPAGLVTQIDSLTVPVTGTTTINSLIFRGIANLAATFSLGGVTAQAPGEVCPAGGPSVGQACNVGGGVGGVMALTGVMSVQVLIHPLPVSLNRMLIGQGGSTNTPFAIDAAAWSTGTGLVNANGVVGGAAGGAYPLVLVTPTFVDPFTNLLPIFVSFQLGDSLPVPEPAAAALIATGVAGLALLARGRRTRSGRRRR